MNRDTTLDYLRGFAILSIVIGHLYFFSGRADGSIVWNICNSIQIPIFIYVSGLLANKSINKYCFKEFIKKRLFRLIIPFTTIFFIWLLLHGINTENTITFFTDEFKQGYWFLFVLFELLLIQSINHFISQRYNVNRMIIDFSMLLVINVYHFLSQNFDTTNQILGLNLIWHYYPIFLIGIYSNSFNKIININLSLIYLLIYCIAFFFMFSQKLHIMLAICNLSGLFFLVSIFNNGFIVAKQSFCKAGQFSLEIYLLHVLAFDVTKNCIPVFDNRWLEALLYFVLASLICYLLILISSILKKSKIVNKLLFGN